MLIPSSEVHNNLDRYLTLAQVEEIVITKDGIPVAVLTAYQEPVKNANIREEQVKYEGKNRISFADFLELTEHSDERYEYINGEVNLLASPSYDHQLAVTKILQVLFSHFKESPCQVFTSPFDVTLKCQDTTNVVQPDVMVICDTKNINEKRKYVGIPTIVIEVLSQSTMQMDMFKKLPVYLHGGVNEYWIVNPFSEELYLYSFAKGDIHQYRVYRKDEIIQSNIFPDLAFSLNEIFK